MKKVHQGDGGKSFHASKKFEWKDDPFFEAVGTIDELISWIGLLKVKLREFSGELEEIQRDLYKINGALFRNEDLDLKERVDWLERKTWEYWECCGEIYKFIIPGSSEEEALINIARTVCRRAERRLVKYMRETGKHKEKMIYLNRLSDYLFSLARYVNWKKGIREKFFE